MKRLTDLGFREVGEWHLSEGKFDYNLRMHSDKKGLLYSFISKKEIFYIGKTTDTLKNRMNGYKNASGSQRTNIRVRAEIIKLLTSQQKVSIHILLDNANLSYQNLRVSLAAGLEDNLIDFIKPTWNYRGHNRIKEQELPPENKNIVIENLQPVLGEGKTVIIRLEKTYWLNGFFNFSKSDIKRLPKKAINVILLLGSSDEFLIPGRFLFATKNGQPRVLGNKALKVWFQDNFRQGAEIRVDIITPTLYRIQL